MTAELTESATGEVTVDVVVCGAGPAGLAAAIHARRAGHSVAVLDPRISPVDKACGEGLMPGAVRELDELGVTAEGARLSGIRYLDGRVQAQALFRRGTGLGVRRTELHAALITTLAGLGVGVTPTRVEHISQDGRSISAAGITGRYLIVADGLHSAARRQLGLEIAPRSSALATRAAPAAPGGRVRAPRWGLRQHFAIEPWTDLVEVHWAPDREAYVTPVGPHLVGIAVLGCAREPFEDQLRAFPQLRERLPDIAATSVRGAGPLRQYARARVAGRALLIGDAAGYVDALTGEGIAVALACARAAIECISADRPQDYEQRWRTLSRRYRTITEVLLWARARPVLARRITPTAARLPRVFTALVDQLAR